MLIRYVRMTFQADKVDNFLEIFNVSKDKIRAMPGCRYLALQRDLAQPHIFLTHSHWENEESLNNYRNSTLFRETWAKTKVLFAEKPLAFSVENYSIVGINEI